MFGNTQNRRQPGKTFWARVTFVGLLPILSWSVDLGDFGDFPRRLSSGIGRMESPIHTVVA